ncbi:MAG: phycobilisome rod-core linker polypeptide [Cyanobacteria bacterium P01_F01_bin.56]
MPTYRFARMCLQRILGREAYSDRELLSWSIFIGTKGIASFVNELLESQEYIDNFGEHVLPYQRRRTLPQRIQGEVTFAHMPCYAEDHLTQLKALGYNFERAYL